MSLERALAAATKALVLGGCTKEATTVTPAPIATTAAPAASIAAPVASTRRREERSCPGAVIAGARTPASFTRLAPLGSGLVTCHHGEDLAPNSDSDSLFFLEPVKGSGLTPGVETQWWFDEAGTKMKGRACAFIHRCHGYSFMYAFDPQKPDDEPRLRAVVEATEITD